MGTTDINQSPSAAQDTPAAAPAATGVVPSAEPKGSNTASAPSAPQNTAAQNAAPSARVIRGDEDAAPDANEMVQLSGAALRKRLERFTRAQLRSEFGTDDFTEIKAKLDRLAEYEQEREEQRRATLAEEERLREDLEAERQARLSIEERLEQEQTRRVISSEQRRIERLADQHIDPDLREDAILRFRRHLRKLSDDEINGYGDREIGDWFAKLAKERAKFARQQPAPPPPAPRVPATNGARTGDRPPEFKSGGQQTEKTFRPGLPNSMTTAEIKKLGYSW